ncbi:hypothetical protein NX90_06500 [Neisseria meningitidis]|nr:hypothetical protein NX89_06100 [Neisseria meningitidis]KIF89896.1 hypothetical protein NX90_06500 [Neisseria meningitidis]KIF91834.1 hypothetical protein NX87_06475 [Neisseria meningitidis]KIF92694.1 hypothetical protein NX88_06540 [Neisseria meningitidis]
MPVIMAEIPFGRQPHRVESARQAMRRCFGREGGAIGSLEKGNGICGQKKLRVKVGRTVRLSVLLSEQETGQLCPD